MKVFGGCNEGNPNAAIRRLGAESNEGRISNTRQLDIISAAIRRGTMKAEFPTRNNQKCSVL
jgi:hypothetical protein